MARQQRLPFDWQNNNSDNAGNIPQVRPLTDEDLNEDISPSVSSQKPASTRAETDPDEPVESADPSPVESSEEHVDGEEPAVAEELQEAYADDIPTSLGQVLIDARAAAGLSIAEVSDRTKVPPQFIEAAENDAFSEFPARLYSRGHLLKLCAAYKIAGQPVLDLYQAAVGGQNPGGNSSGEETKQHGVAKGNVDFSQYAPALQTQKSSTGAGHRLTVTMVSIGLGLIVGVVVVTFIITQIQNARLNKQNDNLDIDSNSAADLTIEEFIQEVPLPLKKLPVP